MLQQVVALYPLSSPNHNSLALQVTRCKLRYILFHHQTTTWGARHCENHRLRYILFHHQTTTRYSNHSSKQSCVISSFITKPQLLDGCKVFGFVALYPLSSPNHNQMSRFTDSRPVALYPLSSPNHNPRVKHFPAHGLRYILFHHQTTTVWASGNPAPCCVISSFITKPQPRGHTKRLFLCCVISSFITKPQLEDLTKENLRVALYPLSSPNHNCAVSILAGMVVALYPLSSPNHNFAN